MIKYNEPIIRPPSEADSFILQATLGCSHNKCAFCATYRSKQFKVRPLDELAAEIHWASENIQGIKKVFLADGDALAAPTDYLLEILEKLKQTLGGLSRISAYASVHNFRSKSEKELSELKKAGLGLLYVGLESGDDEVLRRINKGVDSQEMVDLCNKAHDAQFKMFVTVIQGLAGPKNSLRHAANTAALIDKIKPRFAAALTLMLPWGEEEYKTTYNDSTWRMLTSKEMLLECRELVEKIESKGIIFHANHASNYIPLSGVLQKDKSKLLLKIDNAIKNQDLIKPEFLRGL